MNARCLACAPALGALIVFGLACKGGGSEESAVVLSVLQTAPEDGQMEVPVETRIGFRVDAPIDASTLSSETFLLVDEEGNPVPATVIVGDEPETGELVPDEPLSVITTFTATLTTGLASIDGATLEEDFEWTFRTLDSEWGEDEWLEEIGTGVSSQQSIAVDGQSNAVAAWQYEESTGTSIWANRYTRTDLWGAPEPIDDGTGFARDPRLAVDGPGNAFVIWEQGEDVNDSRIWVNRYVVDEGWGAPELVQTGEVAPAQNPSIAADPAGNAIAIWVQRNLEEANTAVWANRYSVGSGWGAPAQIDEMPAALAPPRVSIDMDDDGNAIVVWSRRTVMGEVLWANRYTPGGGWGTSEMIKSDPDTRAIGERLDVSVTGEAFVVWVQNEGPRNDVWGIPFSGSAWGTAERIDRYDDGDKEGPDVAVDGTGVAHAVWSQVETDFKNIWANQHSPGVGWGVPELIEPPNENPQDDADATQPRVGTNSVGNTFVVWRQNWESWGSIWSNRLDPGTGWIEAEVIEDLDRAAKDPRIAVDENRHAHAVWLHQKPNRIEMVRTNRFE